MEVIRILKKTEKKDNIGVIFVDLSSAYNSVNRSELFRILRNKEILDVKEANFLECL